MKHIVDQSLVFYLPLFKADGGAFMSQDSQGLACTKHGTVWMLQGHDFDGVNDYISINPAVNGGTNFTIEIAFKAPDFTDGILIGKSSANDQYIERTSATRFDVNCGGAVNASFTVLPVVVSNWHLLCWRNDGLKSRLFLDNTEASPVGGIDQSGSLSIDQIGTYSAGNYWWKGTIGEVHVYNRALTFPEMMRNYLATKWRYR